MRPSAFLLPVFALACGKSESTAVQPGAAQPGSAQLASAPSVAVAPAKAPTKAPDRGAERTVFSFVDNRLLAHRTATDALLLAPDSNGFAKYVRFGARTNPTDTTWDIATKHGGVPVAVLKGKSGEVNVPLTKALASATSVSALVFNPGAAGMMISLSVNGVKDKARNLSVAPGWSVAAFPVSGALREGENELTFFTGAANVPFAEIQIGGSLAAPSGAPAARPPLASKDTLSLATDAGLAYYVMPPAGALLAGDVLDGACTLAVSAVGQGGKITSGELRGLNGAVALGDAAGGFARIEVRGQGCPVTAVKNLRLVVPGAEPTLPARGAAPKYVMLWVMDSLRADRVKATDPTARAEAPAFMALKESAAVFTHFYVQGNESRTSHASLWTSLYPVVHRMIGEAKSVDLKWTSVDEVARAAGLFTVGISGNGYVRPTRGFGQQWDEFHNNIEEELPVSGEALTKRLYTFIGEKAEPWFAYLGTIDTHVTWRARQPWLAKYSPGYNGRFAAEFSGQNAADAATKKITLTDAEKNHVRAIYDSNVSYQDKLLGELIETLKKDGRWEHTMLIVTADHGDEQWEDGRVGHGASTLDTLIRVPLVVHYPALVGKGVVAQGAELVDVVPTIADALGQKPDPKWQGESLIPMSHGVGVGYGRMAFNSNAEGSHAVRMGDWKIRLAGANDPRVFHMTGKGPLGGEEADLFGKPEAAIPARALLDAAWIFRNWNREWKKSVWGNAANVTAKFVSDVGE